MAFPFMSLDQNFICIFHFPIHATCSTHLTILDFIALITLDEEHKLRHDMGLHFCAKKEIYCQLKYCALYMRLEKTH
jgi:hypothetical protein